MHVHLCFCILKATHLGGADKLCVLGWCCRWRSCWRPSPDGWTASCSWHILCCVLDGVCSSLFVTVTTAVTNVGNCSW